MRMPTKEEIQKSASRAPRNPFPATDIIIDYFDGQKQGIVLIERENEPHGLAIPGGFAEYGISLEDNAIKEAKEETNLDIELLNPEHPLCVHSGPDRDPRAHIFSITYIAKGHGILRAGDDAKRHSARVYSIPELSDLVTNHASEFAFFDHTRALKEYLTRYHGR
jgi:ADP-ribose pyrophosphatase YjhB (NUDIX family)